MKIHFIVALALLPFLFGSSLILKLAIAPYLLWMLFQKDFKYLPALLLYSATGTTISFLILVGCLVITILNYRIYLTNRTKVVFLLSLIPLPIMILNVLERFFVFQQPFLEVVSFTFYYLGLFPFFYSLLVKNFRVDVLYNYIFIISIATIFFQYSILNDVIFIGTAFLALPFFISHLFLFLSFRKKTYSIFLYSITTLFSFLGLTGIIGLSTGLLFSSLIASLLVAFYQFRSKISPIFPGVLLFITFATVTFAIATFDENKIIISEIQSLETELNIFDLNSIVSRSKFKLFEDRAPLWTAAFVNFVTEGSLWPVKNSEDMIFGIQSFNSYSEQDIAAHNLYLELVRNYGLLAGIMVGIAYIIMVFKGFLPLMHRGANIKTVILASLVISIGLYSAMGGQFPLMGFFSFIFIGMVGFMFKLGYETLDHD